jgi:hypothetical protein
VFTLEREQAIHNLYRIFYIALVLLVVMGTTYFTSTTLSSAVEPLVDEALLPTPDIPFVPTPTNTPLPPTQTPTATPTLLPTAEPAATLPAVATDTPAPRPVVQAAVCPDTRALFLRPGNNETVRGVTTIIGTARHDQFQYFKIEYAAGVDAAGGYSYLTGGNSPVINNVLATVDTTRLANGTYTLQLIVVDNTGNFPTPCRVTINVAN